MEAVEPCRADDVVAAVVVVVVTGLILCCRAAGWKAVDGFADAARRKAETVFVFFIIMTDCSSFLLLRLLKKEELVADMIRLAGNCVSYMFSWPLAYLCLIGSLRRWIFCDHWQEILCCEL